MPERVVIGGGLSQTGGLLLDPVRERIAQGVGCSVGPGDVVLAEGGDDAGLLGGRALGEDFIQFGADDARFSLPVFRP
jgi:glucokinase